MVPDPSNAISKLLPDRHPQPDFFICDVADAVLKDLMPTMEHPFYALSKKPETTIRRYMHNGHWLEVIPSVKGQATIYDKDILIYAVSQIMHKLNQGEKVDRRLRFSPRELLIFVNRGTGGKDYEAFIEALERLMGTVIKTNITTHSNGSLVPLGEEEDVGLFHLIESASVRRKNNTPDGRILWAEIQISEWVFNSIRRNKVLTLHRDYFRLRKPIERRLYEIARKFCGSQAAHKVSLENLLKKTGARMPLKRFRHVIRDLARYDHLPDYSVAFEEEDDHVIFSNRGSMPAVIATQPDDCVASIRLHGDTYLKARDAAPGWDVYLLEQEWRDWMTEAPRNPDAAFIGFCRKVFERRGRP